MAFRDALIPWEQQPQEAVDVAWDNPLAAGLALLYSAFDFDRAQIAGPATLVSGVQRSPSHAGIGALFDGSGTIRLPDVAARPSDFTVAVQFLSPDITTSEQIFFSRKSETGAFPQNWVIGVRTSGSAYFQTNADGYASITAPITANRVCTLVATMSPSRVMSLYVDGVLAATRANAADPNNTAPQEVRLSGDDGGFFRVRNGGRVFWAAAWNRCLAAAEVAQVSANPWQLFAPRASRVFVPAGLAAGNSTLSVGFSVQAAGFASLGAGFAVAQVGSSLLATGYAIRSTGSQLLSVGFGVRGAGLNTLSVGFGVGSTGSNSLSVGFGVSGTGFASLNVGFPVSSAGFNFLSASYGVRSPGSTVLSASFAIREAGSQSLNVGYGVRSAGSFTLDSGYAVRNAGFNLLDTGYEVVNVIQSGSNTLSVSYAVAAVGQSTLLAGYGIATAGQASLSTGYAVASSGLTALSVSYAVAGAGQTTLATGYAVGAAGFATLDVGYAVAMDVSTGSNTLAVGYAVRSGASSTLDLGYAVTGRDFDVLNVGFQVESMGIATSNIKMTLRPRISITLKN